jgi:hypothetical protein
MAEPSGFVRGRRREAGTRRRPHPFRTGRGQGISRTRDIGDVTYGNDHVVEG